MKGSATAAAIPKLPHQFAIILCVSVRQRLSELDGRGLTYALKINRLSPQHASAAQWLGCCAAEPKDKGTVPAAAAVFLMEKKSRNAHVSSFQLSVHVKVLKVVKINVAPSTKARCIAAV